MVRVPIYCFALTTYAKGLLCTCSGCQGIALQLVRKLLCTCSATQGKPSQIEIILTRKKQHRTVSPWDHQFAYGSQALYAALRDGVALLIVSQATRSRARSTCWYHGSRKAYQSVGSNRLPLLPSSCPAHPLLCLLRATNKDIGSRTTCSGCEFIALHLLCLLLCTCYATEGKPFTAQGPLQLKV